MAGDPTKTCPHCGEVVPYYAIKCRQCFGDLTARPDEARRGMWGWVVLLVIMVALGGATLASVFTVQPLAQVTIEESSQSVILVWTRYNRPPTTRRIPFSDIAKFELVTDASILGTRFWEVYLVTHEGERIRINRSTTEDLQPYAEDVIKRTRKPLIPINKVDIGETVLSQTPGD